MPYDSGVFTDMDAKIDALDTPTSEEVYEVTIPYDGDMVAASAVQRAVNGGGGGSSSFGSSYLASFIPTNVALTGEFVAQAFDHPPDVAVGSDILLSVDGKTFTINTDGWYTVMFNPKFYSDDENASGQAIAQIDVSGLDSGDLMALMGPYSEESAVIEPADDGYAFRAMRTYLSNFKAGDTFQVVATATMTAGTAKFDCLIQVIRNA